MSKKDFLLRRDTFTPYLGQDEPIFILSLWDIGQWDSEGRATLKYELVQEQEGKAPIVLFAGKDFSPGHSTAIDSDSCVEGLMGFLTVKPGDTDDDYFKDYTRAQLAFCAEHAEALSSEIENWELAGVEE
jgi:hypothetical protein